MDDLADDQHVAELWRLIGRLGAAADDPNQPASDRTSRGVLVVVGPATTGNWHVSLSHPERDVRSLPQAIGAVGIVQRAAAVHCAVRAGPPPRWTHTEYFVRRIDRLQ